MYILLGTLRIDIFFLFIRFLNFLITLNLINIFNNIIYIIVIFYIKNYFEVVFKISLSVCEIIILYRIFQMNFVTFCNYSNHKFTVFIL